MNAGDLEVLRVALNRLVDRIAKLEANALHHETCRVQRMCSCSCKGYVEPPAEQLTTADREENTRLKAQISVVTSERDEALVSVKQAVAAERERCLEWAQSKHLVIPGGMSMERIRDAIRDGRTVPK